MNFFISRIDKGAVERYEPNFSCRALVTKVQVQQYEARELAQKLFDGSAEHLLSAFLGGKQLSSAEIERLKRLVDQLGEV